MPRIASQVDRSELPHGERIRLLEGDVQELRQDVADILNGEARRDDRLKTDTLSSISSAATMMQAQGAKLTEHGKQLEEQGEILKELRDNSRASAEERTKRVSRERTAEKKESRKFWLALVALLVPVLTACIYVMAHVSAPPAPSSVPPSVEHEAPKPKE